MRPCCCACRTASAAALIVTQGKEAFYSKQSDGAQAKLTNMTKMKDDAEKMARELQQNLTEAELKTSQLQQQLAAAVDTHASAQQASAAALSVVEAKVVALEQRLERVQDNRKTSCTMLVLPKTPPNQSHWLSPTVAFLIV